MDRSLRSIDADGHMRVEESRISKANICPYLGREIPNWQALGLDPERTYRLFRDPKELEKGASSFDGKPLLIRHVPVSAELPNKELWVGTLGHCTFEAPYLVTRPLTVLTKEAIDLIESGEQRELSAGYRYEAVMEPGVWGGQQYDGRMVNIRGNHVAIVSEGRAGPDVHVADHLPPELRSMKNRRKINLLKRFLRDDADLMALDGMLGETPAESVLSLDEEEMKRAEDDYRAEHEKAEDAELTDEEREEAYKRARDKKAKDSKHSKDRAKDEEREEEAEDEEEHEEKPKAKDRRHGRDAKHSRDRRGAHDAETDHRKDFEPIKGEDSVTKDEMNRAVKEAVEAERRRSREAIQAREAVKPIVGSVSLAMDSAEDIYRFALKHAGVKTEGVHPSAYPALIEMAVNARRSSAASSHAMDAQPSGAVNLDELFHTVRAA